MSRQLLQQVVQSYTISFEDAPSYGVERRSSNLDNEQEGIYNDGTLYNKDFPFIFQPGQILKGKINLIVNKDLNNINLLIKVEGYFLFHFDSNDRKKSDIFSVCISLLPELVDRNQILLTAGEHIFPFEFKLPLKCPSSINIPPDIRVAYAIKSYLYFGDIDKIIEENCFTIEKGFIITQPISVLLRERDPVFLKYKIDLEKCRLRPIDTVDRNLLTKFGGYLELNSRAYEQGETVYINGEIRNNSRNKIISGVLAKLTMETYYQTIVTDIKLERKRLNRTITCTVDEQPISYKETRKWRDVQMQIPHFVPASGANSSQVYSVDYRLVFEVKFQGMERSIVFAEIPLVIGAQVPMDLKNINTEEFNQVLNDTYRINNGGAARISHQVEYNPHLGEFDVSNSLYN